MTVDTKFWCTKLFIISRTLRSLFSTSIWIVISTIILFLFRSVWCRINYPDAHSLIFCIECYWLEELFDWICWSSLQYYSVYNRSIDLWCLYLCTLYSYFIELSYRLHRIILFLLIFGVWALILGVDTHRWITLSPSSVLLSFWTSQILTAKGQERLSPPPPPSPRWGIRLGVVHCVKVTTAAKASPARFSEFPPSSSPFDSTFSLSLLPRRVQKERTPLVTYNEEESFLYLGCKIELSSLRLASSSSQILAPPFSPRVLVKTFHPRTFDRLSLSPSRPAIQLPAEVKDSLMKRIGYSLEKIIRQEFKEGGGGNTRWKLSVDIVNSWYEKIHSSLAKLPVLNLHRVPVNCRRKLEWDNCWCEMGLRPARIVRN